MTKSALKCMIKFENLHKLDKLVEVYEKSWKDAIFVDDAWFHITCHGCEITN